MNAFPPASRPDSHLRTATSALAGWWRAMTLDALIVGVLWLVGLELLHVPWAPVWALLGGVCQFVPGVGGMLAVIGPTLAAAFSGGEDMLFRVAMVLGLYALIVVLEGLVIQPYLLHRTTMVPWWASLLGPIVLGILIPPWGVLIAPPLLAVFYAFKSRRG
jgi:predicted PurR-regulated permease PerM